MSNYPTIIHNMNDFTSMNFNQFNPRPMSSLYENQNNYKNVLLGKSVNSLSEIQPQDVPANGTKAIFPQADDEVIYVKYIGSDCTVKTDTYVKKSSETVEEQLNDDKINTITERIDGLCKTIDKFNSRIESLENKQQNRQNKQNSTTKITKEA